MKTINNIITAGSKTNLFLHKLVDDVIIKASLDPVQSKSLIKNSIPRDLYINVNEDVVASVINGLLYAMIMNATDGDIQISAKEFFSNTIRLSVKDNNCYNNYAIACSLQKIVPLAEQIGGDLNITNQRQKITTIEFSFPIAKEDDQSRFDD